MSVPEHHALLREVVDDFEAVASKLERVIIVLADDESGTVNLALLHRAKEAALQGAGMARGATSQIRRAFD